MSPEGFTDPLASLDVPQDHCFTTCRGQDPAVWAEGHTLHWTFIPPKGFTYLLAALRVPQDHCTVITPRRQDSAIWWAEGHTIHPVIMSPEGFTYLLAALRV